MKDQDPQILAEKLLNFPEEQWQELIEKWCGQDFELKNKVSKLVSENRNARQFIDDLQNRIYDLSKSALKNLKNEPPGTSPGRRKK